MKRDGRQKKKKMKEDQNTRARSHALVVSVNDFSFWSHFEAVSELYLFSSECSISPLYIFLHFDSMARCYLMRTRHLPCVKTMALGGQTHNKSGFVPWNPGKPCTSRVKQIIIIAALAEKLLRLGEHRVSGMGLQFACGISRIVCLNKLNIPFKLNRCSSRCSNIVSSRWCIMFNWIILLNTLLNGAG